MCLLHMMDKLSTMSLILPVQIPTQRGVLLLKEDVLTPFTSLILLLLYWLMRMKVWSLHGKCVVTALHFLQRLTS